MLVLVGARGGKHAAGEHQALLAKAFLLGEPFGVAAEIALQVRPAHLALVAVRSGPDAWNHAPSQRGSVGPAPPPSFGSPSPPLLSAASRFVERSDP